MKGKLTPKESFFLYGVWVVAAFGLFILGLYWGKGQATAGNQEVTTQPVASAPAPVRRVQPQTQLDLPAKEAGPAVPGEETVPSATPPKSANQSTDVTVPLAPRGTAGKLPKASAPAPPAGKETFSIQVGALKTEEEARKLIARLEARGYSGILDEPDSQKDPFYRVRVGSYPTRDDAARAEALLKNQGFLTFIKKIGPTGR